MFCQLFEYICELSQKKKEQNNENHLKNYMLAIKLFSNFVLKMYLYVFVEKN